MSKTSTYPSVESFSTAEKTEFLSNAMCIASGSTTSGGDKITANIPFTTFQSAVTAETTYDASSTAPISGMGVADALASFGGFEVATLDPTTNLPVVTNPSSKTIYLTANGGSAAANVYDEWIYSNSAWEKIGATTVDLSNYYTKTEVDGMIPSVPVTDVTVDGTSVLNQGVAEITMPNGVDFLCMNSITYEMYTRQFKPQYNYAKTDGFDITIHAGDELIVPLEAGYIYNVTGILGVTNDSASAQIKEIRLDLQIQELDPNDDWTDVGTISATVFKDYVNTDEKLMPFAMVAPGAADRRFKFNLIDADNSSPWSDGQARISGLVIQRYSGTQYQLS